jgi:caffeoyl-CoA O-methyltransferase
MLRRLIVISAVAVLVAVSSPAQRRGPRVAPGSESAPPVPKSETEKRVLTTINDMVQAGELYANVPTPDGRMLRILTESVNAKLVVEVGTSTGISGLWFSMALDKTGGRLLTHDIDAGRIATARANFKKAGVDRSITVVEGDARQTLTRIKDPIDVVFIDADKEGYIEYLKILLPLVRAGGLILAHNTDMVQEYMRVVTTNPDLETVVFSGGGGLAITLKKR